MLARVCTFFAILLVVACATAYPLTWGHWGSVVYIGEDWGTEASIENGRGYFAITSGKPPIAPGFHSLGWNSRQVSYGDLWRVKVNKGFKPNSGGEVSFPLWMVALLVVLMIGWGRWRRGQRPAVGFPVQTALSSERETPAGRPG